MRSEAASVGAFLLELQDRLCAALEGEETGAARFREDRFETPEGGLARPRVLEGGDVIEKSAVHFSHTFGGELPAAATARRPELAGRRYEAVSVSLRGDSTASTAGAGAAVGGLEAEGTETATRSGAWGLAGSGAEDPAGAEASDAAPGGAEPAATGDPRTTGPVLGSSTCILRSRYTSVGIRPPRRCSRRSAAPSGRMTM